MKKLFLLPTSLATLCAALLFSCTSDIEFPPPPPSSSSADEQQKYSSSTKPNVSSSSLVPSSSSAVLSSSSVVMLSSSSAITSSGLCAGFANGTTREHYGKNKAQFCDERDGKKYVYVIIGLQTWMAENLNYNTTESKCYSDNAANCATYGRLYDWATAKTVCHSGWHLPTNLEWDELTRYVDSDKGTSSPYNSSTAGKYLKATSRWNSSSNGNGTDAYGFAALPGGGGGYGYIGGSFEFLGTHGDWWSASEIDADEAYTRYMYHDSDIFGFYKNKKSYLFSVRCVKD